MIPYILCHFIAILGAMYLFLCIFKCKLDYFAQRLRNKHVVVTGGSSGIGREIALIAARKGAHVTVVARNVEKLLNTVKDLQRAASDETQVMRYISLDCSQAEKTEELLKDLDQLNPIYMLVNCAGVSFSGRLEDSNTSEFEKMVAANIYGTVYPTKAIIPGMMKRREGVIIITGSQVSLMGLYGYSLYSATKFALRGFAESLHMELRDHGITVSMALPPDTETPGYIEENKTKPLETQEISDMGGIYSAERVAQDMMRGALNGKFFSYTGLPSYFSTRLCAGFSPITSIPQFFVEICCMGIMRFIALLHICSFYRIVSSYKDVREGNSDAVHSLINN